jgi:hypothetical protein
VSPSSGGPVVRHYVRYEQHGTDTTVTCERFRHHAPSGSAAVRSSAHAEIRTFDSTDARLLWRSVKVTWRAVLQAKLLGVALKYGHHAKWPARRAP